MKEDHEDFYREFNLIKARKNPSKINLRTHQTQAIKDLNEWFENDYSSNKGGILVLPTGGGKTFTAVRFLCQGPLSEGYKILWLAHTHHLLEQAFYSFGPKKIDVDQGYEVGFIQEPKNRLNVRVVSGNKNQYSINEIQPTDDVLICTLQTVSRGFKRGQPDLQAFLDSSHGKIIVVFDEAHHSPAPSYRRLIVDLRNTYKDMHLLGLTATPTYADEKKKGWLKDLFPQDILYQISINDLMAQNILAEPIFEKPVKTHFEPDFDDAEYNKWINSFRDLPEDIIGQLANKRSRNQFIARVYAENKHKYKKTLIFADRWNQCVQLCEFLREEGVRAGTMFSHVYVTPNGRTLGSGVANARTLEKFRNDELDVLINIRMLTEGTDVPNVNSVFLTRQTTSKILLTQMIGRGLRGIEFNGTPEAYIVSFVDDWSHKINWAEWDPLEESSELPPDVAPPIHDKPPLDLISIDLVRKLSRLMFDGNGVETGPFLKSVPIGWYYTKFYSLSKGQDDYNEVNRLALVFNDEKEGYERFMDRLISSNLSSYEEEEIRFEDHLDNIEKWSEQFFGDVDSMGDVENNIFYIACHMAQNEKEKPQFFPFEERDVHDIDFLARKYMEFSQIEADSALREEYMRNDRYWYTIYPSYELFKQQFDGCVNRILNLRRHKLSPAFKTPTKPGQGPSDEQKRKVKDKYPVCLGCGEDRKQILEVDHVNPRYMGGKDDIDNLQTLCIHCNTAKNTKEIDFRFNKSNLPKPLPEIPDLTPPHNNVDKIENWEHYLQREVNFFYCASAVKSVNASNPQVWNVVLNEGNDPSWLQKHLRTLADKISFYRKEAGLKGPDVIQIV
ncbi:MAG: DEAD/DEAH box helicase family protein [Methanobacterium sp.]